jgi:hypothetical protein
MAALADQIHDGPMPLAHLNFVLLETNQLRSSQSTTNKHGQHGIVALGTEARASSKPQNLRGLFDRQPVAGAKPELLHAFHAADSGGQFRAQQPGVSGFMSQTTHGCELLIDRVRGQTAGFQVHAVTHDNDAIECESRLRAVPSSELIDGVLVNAAGRRRSEAVQDRQLGVIQIWQPEHGATIIRFAFFPAHGRRPPVPQNRSTARGARIATLTWARVGLGW